MIGVNGKDQFYLKIDQYNVVLVQLACSILYILLLGVHKNASKSFLFVIHHNNFSIHYFHIVKTKIHCGVYQNVLKITIFQSL